MNRRLRRDPAGCTVAEDLSQSPSTVKQFHRWSGGQIPSRYFRTAQEDHLLNPDDAPPCSVSPAPWIFAGCFGEDVSASRPRITTAACRPRLVSSSYPSGGRLPMMICIVAAIRLRDRDCCHFSWWALPGGPASPCSHCAESAKAQARQVRIHHLPVDQIEVPGRSC